LCCGQIDRWVALEEGFRRAADLGRWQRGRRIERGGLGQPDQFAFLVGMQRCCHAPALLAAQWRALAPHQRHLLAVLHHAPLTAGFHHGVDVIARALADAGDDQRPCRDLS
jgi:hypothetical protein